MTCNKKKDKYWKEFGETGIINFYIDSIPTEQFLFAEITFSNNDYKTPIVKFKLEKNNLADKLFNTIKKHYKRLELIERYQGKVNSVISVLKRNINTYGKHLDYIRNMEATLEESNQLKIDYGMNYWKAVLLEELSKKSLFYTHNKI